MITVTPIDTPGLGDRTYLAHDGEVALVVDPQRDYDRVLEAAEAAGSPLLAEIPPKVGSRPRQGESMRSSAGGTRSMSRHRRVRAVASATRTTSRPALIWSATAAARSCAGRRQRGCCWGARIWCARFCRLVMR